MSDKPPGEGLYIDSDWKEEAAKEKERLAEQEQKEKKEEKESGPPGAATFPELVNLLAMQAVISLGGFQGPGGERIPPNPAAAKHHIDLIEMLEKKTEGNVSEEESRMLTSVLYELRMQYVQSTTGQPPPAPGDPTKE